MALLPVRRSDPKSPAAADWDPFQEFTDLYERMGRLLEHGLAEFDRAVGGWSPAVDLEETDDAYLVEAELPGVKQDDINVEYREGELTISGELKEKERIGVLRRRTRRTGRFDYRVVLPTEIEADKIDASLVDGVLTVTIPKVETARPRRIQIHTASTPALEQAS